LILDFPSSPVLNQKYVLGGKTWSWNGVAWQLSGTSSLPSTVLMPINGGTGATTLTGYIKGSGTLTFTATNTIPGSDIVGGIAGSAASVAQSITFNSGGSGDASGASFDGSAARIISYNTVGAQKASADLAAIAALVGTSGFLKKTAANTWALDTAAYLTTSTTPATIGAQDADPDLTAIAGLAGTAGYLKKTAANTWVLDNTTFVGGTISVSGDATGSGTTNIPITLASVNSNTGTFGTASSVPSFTVNAKGLITAVSPISITPTAIGAQPSDADLTAIASLAGTAGYLKKTAADTWILDTTSFVGGTISVTGDGTGSGTNSIPLTLATVNSNVGSFGGSSTIPVVTVNGKGLVTAASTAAVVAPAGTLTGTALASGVVSSSLTSLGTLSGLSVSGNATIGANFIRSVATGLTSSGTTQGTALALIKDINVVSTVAASSGVSLPTATAGMTVIVMNKGANTLLVYPPTGAAIDSLATNVAFTLPVGARLMFIASTATQWDSLNATYT
jgi:hypothetical protein